jgi:Ran-binding protein 3
LTAALINVVMTGEEDETTIFKCNARAFHFDKDAKAWKERGRGVLKLNRTTPSVDGFGLASDDEGETKAPAKKSGRLIMRTDGTLVVILNAAIYEGMKPGAEPSGNQLPLTVMENGSNVPIALKV